MFVLADWAAAPPDGKLYLGGAGINQVFVKDLPAGMWLSQFREDGLGAGWAARLGLYNGVGSIRAGEDADARQLQRG